MGLMKNRSHLTLFLLCLVVGLPQISTAESKYMGAGSCASSNCHGAPLPRNSSNVLQNEYTTWSKKDAHSKAWRVLTSEDSKKIGFNLGIQDPSKEPLCLNCHAPTIPDNLKGHKYAVEDGVTCETCHGASENWLKSHTTKSATHQDNLKNGLKDLSSLEERAKFCLDCHQGNESQYVDHRMIGAGHPRLSFELDTYSMIQPKHWQYDEDYIQRKGSYNPIKAWLIGQIEVARGSLAIMASDKRSKNGIWPELSMFNCYACHHSLNQKQWRSREYKNGPGELRLNISSLLVVRDAMNIVSTSTATKITAGLSKLHDQYKSGEAQETIAQIDSALSNDATKAVANYEYSASATMLLLKGLAKFAATTPHPQYEEAEQLVMGLSAILSSNPAEEKRLQKAIDDIYASLKNPADFIAEDFTTATKKFDELL
jgi:nitrate reductase cytochrome c-type subunit